MTLQESWDELKESSTHNCDCNFCMVAIQIAEKSLQHVQRSISSNEVDNFLVHVFQPKYKPLKKRN